MSLLTYVLLPPPPPPPLFFLFLAEYFIMGLTSVLSLDRRIVRCVRCGQEQDRDHNEAHNIAQATLQWTSTHTWLSILPRESQQLMRKIRIADIYSLHFIKP
jgi:hypothetical protein